MVVVVVLVVSCGTRGVGLCCWPFLTGLAEWSKPGGVVPGLTHFCLFVCCCYCCLLLVRLSSSLLQLPLWFLLALVLGVNEASWWCMHVHDSPII